MINYRKASAEDIEVLVSLRILMLKEGTELSAEFEKKLAENTRQYILEGFNNQTYQVLVAELNGEIVAMSGLTYYTLPPNDHCPNGKTAYIGSVYTKPNYRRQGIVSKLLDITVEEAKKSGCERLQLHTTDMGKTIYESYGFEYSAISMAYYPFR
ncbi:GNAT family N-acetyltransferase [Anaerocolumna sp. AGMB13025]|uniref:GNAT family N-acetyltransferase n=1 Tax=Anaerocolumna sp. AGMB13025 TaxID=3039116 RepID=UPI00241D9052|nr:GNAT family N-acetyltransferase [Anaerocolumna sp. AGMB13025]WFR55138.1 GNAT family N-acetyltransferase [Anaerocolumna sp. AGMB13025]